MTSEVAAALAAVEKNLPATERVVSIGEGEIPFAILPAGMTARVLQDALDADGTSLPLFVGSPE